MDNPIKKATIVIPTYNEAKNISGLITRIFAAVPKSVCSLNVLVVDDNSPDGTARIAAALDRPGREVAVLQQEKKMGIGQAYRAGLKKGLELGSDYILTMDGDGSHRPEQLPDFFRSAAGGADLVIGSRYTSGGSVQNWSWLRRIISWGANNIAGFLLGMRISDVTSGYRLYCRPALAALDLDSIKSDGYSFLEEILFNFYLGKALIREVPISFDERLHGRSKLDRREMFKFFWTIWRLRSRGRHA